ncbi:MAG: ABC transporter ATP-binding protein, partial [Actinomycetota bacterium]
FGGGTGVSAAFEIAADGPEVTVVFGPSGSGKTTLLRCIAGLERPDAGRISWGSEVWSDAQENRWLPPRNRRVGLLHQDPALFPRRSVEGNVAYGLRRMPASERRLRVGEMVEAFGITQLASRRPAQLSGGERQRVALARAVAPRPRLLLLDEPISGLDAPARESLRGELRRLLLASGIPSILVTHDRSEALALGDRMIVLIDGAVRQVGPVERVFANPADPQVARAVGVENVLRGRITGHGDGVVVAEVAGRRLVAVDPGLQKGDVLVCIRAEEVMLRLPERGAAGSARNHLEATVTEVLRDGPLYRVRMDCGFALDALVTAQAVDELGLAAGTQVDAVVKAPSIHCIPHPH